MSRLIFEGDTRERFGELFPKPFIEEVRVFDDKIEADISLYFLVNEGQEHLYTDEIDPLELSSTFLTNNDWAGQLRVYVGPQTEHFYGVESGVVEDAISLISDPTNEFHYQNPLSISNGGTILLDQLSSFRADIFYNSEGNKYIRFFRTETFRGARYDQFFTDRASATSYLLCYSFFDGMLEISDNFREAPNSVKAGAAFEVHIYQEFQNRKNKFNLMKKQVSSLAYEKIVNSDGSLNTDKQIAYFEASGNTFDNTPIMSLDRVFRKTDLINHDQILSTIQPIIQPFVGSIEEANIISTTLQQNNDNPRLLVALQRNINNFSNKSSTTTIGTLYSNLVEAVVNIDSTLSSSEELEKRLVVNKKIKDYRQVFDFSLLDNIQITSTPNDEYLHLPFITRKIEVRTRPANAEEDFLVDNTSFLFFDYEKALNYKSEIGNIFNAYNLMQIFGAKSLNKYFRPVELSVIKNDLQPPGNQTAEAASYKIQYGEGYLDGIQHSRFTPRSYQIDSYIDFNSADDGERGRQDAHIAERAFDTFDGLENYRLKCYQIRDFETVEAATNILHEYDVNFIFSDATMIFYDIFIKQKMQTLNSQLQTYYDYAQQFCSYNNLDNIFNTFFVNSANSEFQQPYVWNEAPLYYYLMIALIQSSYADMDINARTRNSGILIDETDIKNKAGFMRTSISPENGNLQSLEVFSSNFNNLYEVYFQRGNGFDQKFDIYEDIL